MDKSRDDTLVERIKRLERECSRSRRVSQALFGIGCVLLIALAADKNAVQKEVESEIYWLRSPDGRRSAVLRNANDGGANVMIFNKQNVPVVILGADRDGHGSLKIADKNGEDRIVANLDSDGYPSFRLYGKDRSEINLSQRSDGYAGLLMIGDPTKFARWFLGVHPDGTSHFVQHNKANEPCFSLQEQENGTALLGMPSDGQGTPGLTFVIDPDGKPILRLFDKTGKNVFHAP